MLRWFDKYKYLLAPLLAGILLGQPVTSLAYLTVNGNVLSSAVSMDVEQIVNLGDILQGGCSSLSKGSFNVSNSLTSFAMSTKFHVAANTPNYSKVIENGRQRFGTFRAEVRSDSNNSTILDTTETSITSGPNIPALGTQQYMVKACVADDYPKGAMTFTVIVQGAAVGA